ncbi:hypothetical protein KK120_18785 [Virgibacillus dakarensis]|nr:hypothetical protein [Virgibacillus dakarensis]
MKWNAVAYTITLSSPARLITKYQHYKDTLQQIHEFEDNKYFKYLFGSDYSINQFFTDFHNETYFFNEMLFTIENEDIDKVFILTRYIHLISPFQLRKLCTICKARNIELIFPYQELDNISHPDFFNQYSHLAV